MKTIYVFSRVTSEQNPRLVQATAIAEDGTRLAGHTCSDEGYVRFDMGFTSTRKHEQYDAHYGKGNWRLEFVNESHPGLRDAMALNDAMSAT